MERLIYHMLNYLRHPCLVSIPGKIHQPYKLLLKLAAITLGVGIAAGIFETMLIQFQVIPAPGSSVMDRGVIPMPVFILAATILAPVVEELMFRAQLRRFTLSLIFIAFIFGMILSILTKTRWAFMVSPFIFIVLFTVYRFNLAGSISRKFRFWKAVFPFHFYLTAICFALVHLVNFERGIHLLPLGLLYTLPQLAAGLVLGYTRMNYGLKYSMALHSLYNLLPALFLLARY